MANAPSASTPASAPGSLRSRTIRASLWTLVEIGGSRVLRLAGNLVLTRLLFPEVFGLMTLVQAFAVGLQMISDVGLGPSVIQNPRGTEPRFLNTVWSLQILRGLIIWVALAALAYPLAQYYEQPELQWLLPVVGISAVLAGFNSTSRYTLNRKLHLGRLTFFDLVAQAVALVVMIAWALLISRTVWALVAGNVANALVRMVLSYRLVPGARNRWCWDRAAVVEIIRFGKWILLASAVGVLAMQVDKILLGKAFSEALLGFYGIAFLLASMPDNLVSMLGYRVIFPAASECADRPREELRAIIIRNRGPFLLALAVPMALLAVCSDVLVNLLYDPRYASVGWMLSLLAIGLWPRVLTNTMGVALLAIGQSKYIALASGLRFLFLLVGILLAASHYGPFEVVVVIATASLIDYLAELIGQARHGLLALRQDLLTTIAWLAVLLGLLWIRVQLGFGLPFLPPATEVLACR